MQSDKELKEFDRWSVPRPSSDKHGEDSINNPISGQLRGLNPRNWRQQGNQLIADTDFGEFGQTIPTNLLLDGIDASGLPKFKKL